GREGTGPTARIAFGNSAVDAHPYLSFAAPHPPRPRPGPVRPMDRARLARGQNRIGRLAPDQGPRDEADAAAARKTLRHLATRPPGRGEDPRSGRPLPRLRRRRPLPADELSHRPRPADERLRRLDPAGPG